MGYKVVFAPQARARLEEIVRFIAQDDPVAAFRFGSRLVDRAELLMISRSSARRIGSALTCDGSCVNHTLSTIVFVQTNN